MNSSTYVLHVCLIREDIRWRQQKTQNNLRSEAGFETKRSWNASQSSVTCRWLDGRSAAKLSRFTSGITHGQLHGSVSMVWGSRLSVPRPRRTLGACSLAEWFREGHVFSWILAQQCSFLLEWAWLHKRAVVNREAQLFLPAVPGVAHSFSVSLPSAWTNSISTRCVNQNSPWWTLYISSAGKRLIFTMNAIIFLFEYEKLL